MRQTDPYSYSTDYGRLLQLLEGGHRIICLVDYVMDYGERRMVCDDVCTAVKDRYGARFQARGITYIDWGGEHENRTFGEACEHNNVRFIDPYI